MPLVPGCRQDDPFKRACPSTTRLFNTLNAALRAVRNDCVDECLPPSPSCPVWIARATPLVSYPNRLGPQLEFIAGRQRCSYSEKVRLLASESSRSGLRSRRTHLSYLSCSLGVRARQTSSRACKEMTRMVGPPHSPAPGCDWCSVGEVPLHYLRPAPAMGFDCIHEVDILHRLAISTYHDHILASWWRTSASDHRSRLILGFKASCHRREHSECTDQLSSASSGTVVTVIRSGCRLPTSREIRAHL